MSDKPQRKRELSYENKAIELARAFLRKQRDKVQKERVRIKGLQITPEATYYDDSQGRKPGDSNWTKWEWDIHPYVAVTSLLLIIAFISLTIVFSDKAAVFFSDLLNGIGTNFGWLYILAANLFLIVLIYLALSKYGGIKLGGPDAVPEFSNLSWYAMLFIAGMGIGLMFWSVAEPIFHYTKPSPMYDVLARTPESAQTALGVTYFHWGLHAWGIYALVGLSLAFFAYNRGLPLTIRSVFYPLLGDKIYGFWGNFIDVLSVMATLFGLATSLGLGVQQVTSGFNYLFGWPNETSFIVSLIAIITSLATISVVAGLDKGVRLLSNINMYVAAAFMLFILAVGPTTYIIKGFTQNIGFYIQNLPQQSFWVETYHGIKGSNWQNLWTIFYWGSWISWSPFVGMFIARVSKGRTVSEFITGVIILPTILSFFWMAVLGGSALNLQSLGLADIAGAVEENVSTALFVMLESFPFTFVTSFVAVILVMIFFITSADSGSLVVDHLTSGGKLHSPVKQRVFWASIVGVCAAVLLYGGGITALQSATVATGLPFTIVLVVMVYSLFRGLKQEYYHATIIKKISPDVQNFKVPLDKMKDKDLIMAMFDEQEEANKQKKESQEV